MRIVVILLLLSAGVGAQQRFEVASVREKTSQESGSFSLAPVRFVNMPLNTIIALAYVENLREALTQQHRFDFSKVNGRLLETKFDIDTRGDGDQREMLRTLLQERFGLRTHNEAREVVQYALTAREKVSRFLKPSTVDCATRVPEQERAPECSLSNDRRGGVRVRRFTGTIEELIRREVSPRIQAPVVDWTGLKGNFTWELAVRPLRDESDMIPAITDALAELGLKLERTKGLADVIVIDAVRMPTPN